MKKFIFFARVCSWLILVLPLSLSAQDTTSVYPNYVVIGAFAFKENAIEFTDEANKKNNLPAKFDMNPNRNLFYVFVLTTPDRELAFSEALKLRTDTKYFDTWVYSGALGELGLAQRGTQNQDLNPETGGEIHSLNAGLSQARLRDVNVNSQSQGRKGKSTDHPEGSVEQFSETLASGGTVSQSRNSLQNNRGEGTIPDEEQSNAAITRSERNEALSSSQSRIDQNDGVASGKKATRKTTGQNATHGSAQPQKLQTGPGVELTSQKNAIAADDKLATTATGNDATSRQGNVTARQGSAEQSGQGNLQAENAQQNQTGKSTSQKRGTTAAQNDHATNVAGNDQIARQENVTARQGSAEQSLQRNLQAENAQQNRAGKSTSQKSGTTAAQNEMLAKNTTSNDPASRDGNFKPGQASTQASKQSNKVDPATGKENQQQVGNPVSTSNGQQDGVVRNNPSDPGRANGKNATTEGTNTASAPITKESDKSLTDAGRKALAENRERQAALGPPPQRATTAQLTKEEVTGKDFYFHLFRGDNLEMVDGEVDAIDFEKSRRMATYQGNTSVKVTMPSGKTKQISFVCQVFGYRKQQREFDPATPPEDLYLDDKGNLVVPFELVRMQKGDIAIMYNVFFFKDAAVMRPESRYEVNNLLDLLAENPAYKIMIHGHTNGNAAGKIIRMDTPENFYSLTGTKQGFGSAKELSEERAIVIRDFLVNSGISENRMQVKAWGGKKPIHDKHSVRANENVRVEIEILSE